MKCVSRVQPGVGQYESVLYERKVSLWLGLVKVINFYMAVRSFSVLSFLPHITHYSGCTLCVSQPPIQRVCVCRSVWGMASIQTHTHTHKHLTRTQRDVNARKLTEHSAIAFRINFRTIAWKLGYWDQSGAFVCVRFGAIRACHLRVEKIDGENEKCRAENKNSNTYAIWVLTAEAPAAPALARYSLYWLCAIPHSISMG